MTTQINSTRDAQGSYSFSTRDLIAIGFRQKRAIVITFWSLLAGAILATVMMPSDYQASIKFLIERSRIDPVVSAGHDAESVKTDVTEEELNSEVELIKSDDVLRQVVVATGLNHFHGLRNYVDHALGYVGLNQTEDQKIAKAAIRLGKELNIQLIKKSNLITVAYSSSDPKLAARVLQCLDEAFAEEPGGSPSAGRVSVLRSGSAGLSEESG